MTWFPAQRGDEMLGRVRQIDILQRRRRMTVNKWRKVQSYQSLW